MANADYETHEHDVLVIGAGGAGLRAAIEAAGQGVSVGLVCKSLLGKAHTVMAEGGIAAALGFIVGFPLSRVPLTAVPERTGLSQAFGGMAAALVGTAKYYLWLDQGEITSFRMAVVAGEVILGCLTATGGLMAAGKLAEVISTRPVTYKGQNIVSFLLLGAAATLGVVLVVDPNQSWAFPIIIALALVFGGAPVINTLVHSRSAAFSPLFLAGLLLVIAGSVMVLVFAPRGETNQELRVESRESEKSHPHPGHLPEGKGA